MEEYTQITLDQWMEWKEDIRQKLSETADNFVHIGYRLKQIRDSGMYGGAADIFEFAQNEYGLGKSTVSRFIAIDEKYSEGGNSLELKKEFRGFSSSKLSEMLTLPDSELQLVTEKTTVKEIRDLKRFNAQGIDAEVGVGHQETEGGAGLGGSRAPLEKCLIDFFRTRRETLGEVLKCLNGETRDYKKAAELMAPSGQASHRKGIMFLFFYDWNTGVKYKLMTEPEPASMRWEELLDIVAENGETWEQLYEPLEEQEEKPAGEQEGNAIPTRENQAFPVAATSKEEDKKEPTEETEEKEGKNATSTRENQGFSAVATSQQDKEAKAPEGKQKDEADTPSSDEREKRIKRCLTLLDIIRGSLKLGSFQVARTQTEELLRLVKNLED